MNENVLYLSKKIPVMLLGPPGIGKTAIITDFANKIGANLVDIRLSAETPSTFEGKDYVDLKSGNLKKARAWWLQRIDNNRENNIPTVLFFDEYTNAPDALQQLAYSPFNERKLHGISFDYKLNNGNAGLYVFGAGNRVEDETGAREMVYASKTRVFTVDFKVTPKEWLKWAEENNINNKIRSFIYTNPDALIEKPSTGTACPREWANLSYALDCGIPCKEAAHGTIRGANEAKFCAFYRDSEICPSIDDIVNGNAKKPTEVLLSSFTKILSLALSDDDNVAEHFPVVYRWIADQSKACEFMFLRYSVDLLAVKLSKSPECMKILKEASKKVGIN